MADHHEIRRIEAALPLTLNGTGLDEPSGESDFMLLSWMDAKDYRVPPYWSEARDRWLRSFAIQNGPLKTAIVTFVNKVVTIPFSIQAIDHSAHRHVERALQIERTLRRVSGSMSSGFLKGFRTTMKMFLMDFLTQDNGSFMLIMGRGRADGPIVGSPMGVMHLDSQKCVRTKDPEFPVKYRHTDGKVYKLHYTRVVEMANLPSPETALNGIGLCPVSCCIEAAQELWDMYTYSSEKFGSRPPKQILYAKKGATVKNIQDAITHWYAKMDAEGNSRFAGTLIAAPRVSTQELDLQLLDLASAPDGFNRKDVSILDKSEIAAAFGLDLRDLSAAYGVAGQTRADAEVQDRKGRGKGVGEFLETFSDVFAERYVNIEHFIFVSDYVDDEQDQQRAAIRDQRSAARERDLRSGLTTIRVEREQMWESGEISQQQFEDMELLDGRLPNGLDVLLLFQDEDPQMQEWLDLGVEDPTHISDHDPLEMSDLIHDRIIEVSAFINVQTNPQTARKGRQARAALEKLSSMYQVPLGEELADQATLEAMDAGGEAVTDLTPTSETMLKDVKKKALSPSEINRILDGYRDEFEYLIFRVSEEEISPNEFEEAVIILLTTVLTTLFLAGSELSRDALDRDEAARLALQEQLDIHLSSARGLAQQLQMQILMGSPMSAAQLNQRINLWVNRAASLAYLGLLYRPDNPFLRWVRNPQKESCTDCIRYDGQVHPASEWRERELWPRNIKLACGGWLCGCEFEESGGPARGAF